MRFPLSWAPALLLGAGAAITVGVDLQRALPLRLPLAEALPAMIGEFRGRDVELSRREVEVAGMTTYLLREFASGDSAGGFSVYVGYYAQQAQGRTIHSPKNCLPGAGWEALAAGRMRVAAPDGSVEVNRYLLQHEEARALVLYWYQGRGRVASSEYAVKLDLLRDAALRQRSDEALVRIVVPVTGSEAAALATAQQAAVAIIPALNRALPQ